MSCSAAVLCSLIEKFSSDTGPGGLIRILQHDPTIPASNRIGQYQPDTCAEGKMAYLGIELASEDPLTDAPMALFRGTILFHLCSCGNDAESRTIMLSDRVTSLLLGVGEIPDNRWSFDPSNDDITYLSFKYLRGGALFTDDSERRCKVVSAAATWRCTPCPCPE